MNRWQSSIAAWAVFTSAAHASLVPAPQESRPNEERAIVVEARAVDESGAPLAGATLHLLTHGLRTRPSDATGRIRGVLADATPMVYDAVEIRCEGRAAALLQRLRFDRGQPCDIGAVVLPALAAGELSRIVERTAPARPGETASRPSELRVRVTAAGAPVPGASVSVHRLTEVKGATHIGTPRGPELQSRKTR